jgi:hypothetical protein
MNMTATPELTLKVWVEDVWDTVSLTVAPDWAVDRVKTEALEMAIGRCDPAQYQVKYHGALVLNENATMADINVGNSATLTLLSARRRPTR